jgi:thiol-disulfide isomerase/thioredoxin
MNEPSVGAAASSGRPSLIARLGLAVVHPRWALAIAADRGHAGRSGSDLIAAFVVLLVATRLRGLVTAVWLAGAVDSGLGMRAAIRVLTGALTVDLGLLVLGALAVFALAGARRNLGRAFDLACIAALPLVLVDLGVTVAVRLVGIESVPGALGWLLAALSYAWMGALIALAIRPARSAPVRLAPLPSAVLRRGRRLGRAIAVVAAVGVAVQLVWIADHVDLVRPMTSGDAAPAIALARIERGGALGDPITLASVRGRVTVVDFWATWCKPCLIAMPRLDKLARDYPDVAVIAINLDDRVAARALFDQRSYAMTLVTDDGDVSERYGVSSIPHTVVIDRHGMVRQIVRGNASDVARLVESLRSAE